MFLRRDELAKMAVGGSGPEKGWFLLFCRGAAGHLGQGNSPQATVSCPKVVEGSQTQWGLLAPRVGFCAHPAGGPPSAASPWAPSYLVLELIQLH